MLQIGVTYGRKAGALIQQTIGFYEAYFRTKSGLAWDSVVQVAQKFLPFLQENTPNLVEELHGVAEGSGIPFESILAINVRTEISMGMIADGCTVAAWKTDDFMVAGQNWDVRYVCSADPEYLLTRLLQWECPQKGRLLLLHIKPNDGKPNMSFVTEAGLLTKSGINSSGVAVLLNAVICRGVNYSALPVHFALRLVLESQSRAEAVERICKSGACTAAHILVADDTGATSLEVSHLDTVKLEMVDGQIAHTNHFVGEHVTGAQSVLTFFPDSERRMSRISALLKEKKAAVATDGVKLLERMLEDEDGYPGSINRKETPEKDLATLYSIALDLRARTGRVRLGRPTESEGTWILNPQQL